MSNIIYFSELIGKEVVDVDAKTVGWSKDFVLAPFGEKSPEVSHLIILGKHGSFKIPWKEVNRYSDVIYLNLPQSKLTIEEISRKDILLGRVLLDKQLVDMHGLKVVRVNDIAMAEVGGRLAVMSFDVGTKGILRRLGLRRVSRLLKLRDTLVPWNYAEPLQKELHHIQLKVPRHKIAELHPAEIATVMNELDAREQEMILASLDPKTAAAALEKASPEVRRSVIENLDNAEVVRLLETLPPHEAADVLEVIAPEKREAILGLADKSFAAYIKELLGYTKNTAASVMSNEFVSVPMDYTVGQTIAAVKKVAQEVRTIYYVYVVDEENRLVGLVSLRDLLLAANRIPIIDIAKKRRRPLHVNLTTPVSQVAETMVKYDAIAIPVVDSRHRLKGIITVDEALEAVLPPIWKKRLPRTFPKVSKEEMNNREGTK